MAAIRAGSFAFESLERLPGWQTILGLQFETLVVNHFRELLPILNPGGSLILSAAPYRKSARDGTPGVQIDLLLQMRNAVELVEVKRKAFIDDSVEDDVAQKIARLPLKGRKSVRTALVYEGELSPSIRENGYFDALVPFGSLVGL